MDTIMGMGMGIEFKNERF